MQHARRLLLATVMVASLGGVSTAQDASPSGSPLSSPDAGVPDGLAAAFPTQLLGEPLEVRTFSGDEVIAGAEEGDAVLALVDIAAVQGVAITDFDIASSSIRRDGLFVGLLAASFSGVPAADVVGDLTRLILELDGEVELTPEVIAGREVTRVGPGSGLTGESVVYVLTSGDVAWYIVATDDDLEQIVAALP